MGGGVKGRLLLGELHCNAGDHSLPDRKMVGHICSHPRGKVQHLGQEKVVKQTGHMGIHHTESWGTETHALNDLLVEAKEGCKPLRLFFLSAKTDPVSCRVISVSRDHGQPSGFAQ